MPKRPSSIDKAPRRPNTYIIRRGDTLSAIATRVYGNGSQWSIISEANPDLDPKRLSVGHALMLPDRPRPLAIGRSRT
jgi:nucleoid-associated protein YgaU